MQAISASGRFHATPVLVPDPPVENLPPSVARAGEISCACCERSPLTGEQAILHVRDEKRTWVCELCERSARNVALFGAARERVLVMPPLLGSRMYEAA